MTRKKLEFLEYAKANIIGTTPKDSWRVERPEVDSLVCKKCGICVDYCIEGCMRMDNEKIVIDYRLCKGCGVCANECPSEAIKMVKER
jgi:pyruvate ferredoxin oxidoreductase delta subunit